MDIRNLRERLTPGLRRLARAAGRDLWHAIAGGPDQPPALPWPRLQTTVLQLLLATALIVLVVVLMPQLREPAGYPYDQWWLITTALSLAVLLVMLRRPLLAWRIVWLALLYELTVLPWLGWPDSGLLLLAAETAILVAVVVLFMASASQRPGVIWWVWLLTAWLAWATPVNLPEWSFYQNGLIPVRFAEFTTWHNGLSLWLVGDPGMLPLQLGGVALVTVVVLAGQWTRRLSRAQRQLAQAQEHGSVLAERARIAREMHDVIAHHMSMIAVRAETAPYRLTAVDGAARDEFLAISQDSRTALNEMRRLLGVLRNGEAPLTAPQPSLADLTGLLETGRRAGATVTLDAHGELTGLPVAVDVCAYRIVQEALSNASQHAPGAPIQVMLRRTGHALALSVRNEPVTGQPPAPAPPPTGHAGQGVRGMRERAAMLGGALYAGPTVEGGFEVAATLPLAAEQVGDEQVGAGA